jgi:hypothetical protein
VITRRALDTHQDPPLSGMTRDMRPGSRETQHHRFYRHRFCQCTS